MKNQQPQNKLTLWLIIGVCTLPVVLSTLIWWMGWGPASKTQGGELINKPTQIQNCIQSFDGKTIVWPKEYQHKWLLLWRGNSAPSSDSRIYLTQQLRLMQGKNKDRIARAFVNEVPYTIPFNGYDQVLTVVGKLCSDKALASNSNISSYQRVYVVDPLGNVMMVLDATKVPKTLHKDLTRLLSVSGIG